MKREDILKYALELEEYTLDTRRIIHENPELSGEEFNTVKLICSHLKKFGITYVEVENGGILGFIEGNNPGKTILLRADMDALPVQESPTNLIRPKKYLSKTDGVAHVCGHDAHTAMLLSAGRIFNEHSKEFDGRVILLFERGEEGGGNLRYLLEYLLENKIQVDACWGMHINAELPTGKFAIRPNALMAGAFVYDITLHGRGGHGSRPDLTNNPVDCFVAIQNALHTARMKYVDPNYPLTFSTCKVLGEKGMNVVGEKLDFGGTVRYFDKEKAFAPFFEMMKRTIEHTSSIYECSVTYNKFESIAIPLKNNDICFEIAEEALVNTFGQENVIEGPLKYGAETMAYIMSYFPGMYLNMGIRNEEIGSGAGHHTPKFDIDESQLKTGVAAHVAFALAFLKKAPEIPFTPYSSSVADLYSGK